MIDKFTEESLGIYWDGEEVDGVTIYGLFLGLRSDYPVPPSDVWPKSCEFSTGKLFGDEWTVFIWDVRIKIWPDRDKWISTVRNTLEKMIAHGAFIAWCGLDGSFVDPPDLFKSEFMSGGVWAVCTNENLFFCEANMGEIFRTLDDATLDLIWIKISEQFRIIRAKKRCI